MAKPLHLLLALGAGGVVAYYASKSMASPMPKTRDDAPPEPPVSGLPPIPGMPPVPGLPDLPGVVVPAALRDPYGVANCVTKEAEALPHSQGGLLGDVQWALMKLGILPKQTPGGASSIDNKCGDMTHKAIEKFQAQKGLPITGYVDVATYMAVKAVAPCAFDQSFFPVVAPTYWGRPDLESDPSLFLAVLVPSASSAVSTPFGEYEYLVRVHKDPSSGTEASGAICPYAVITQIVDQNPNLRGQFKTMPLKVGQHVKLRVPDTTAPNGMRVVPWPAQVP